MRNVLWTVDPALSCTGWAVFYNDTLADHGYVKTPAGMDLAERVQKIAKDICTPVAAVPTEFAIEWPQIYQSSKGDPNDLLSLSAVVGAIMGKYAHRGNVTLYRPKHWKGQVPKQAMVKRILGKLDAEELASYDEAKYTKGIAHNVADAIGIGLYHLGRLG